MAAKRGTKAEMSKEVRRILNKHRVDLTVLDYSYGGSSVRLSGGLWKSDGSDFSVEALTYLMNDLYPYGTLYSDLVNWDLTGGTIRAISQESKFTVDEEN